ncbi:hypothetical protein GCM10022225_07810 [Plantactinospora mayteni]|uniref:Carrier domain-containing protein n=1 Tax=Plantactinospora mayteni TaxID=566021 RepID=A0ABQ4EIC0_9ACTN|nr:phosphopantetheine-binding protein [Plantactinospora mayteni]GIG94473.1 hypothetical protein Pma05_10460 [Plantactinospora mayteni]
MSRIEWSADFERVLRRYLPLLGADTPLTPELSLTEHGLDSLGTVSLLLDLEDTFDVTIPDELLTLTSFASPGAWWDMLTKVGASNES